MRPRPLTYSYCGHIRNGLVVHIPQIPPASPAVSVNELGNTVQELEQRINEQPPSVTPENHSGKGDTMRITVRSKKVLVRIEESSEPMVTWGGVVHLANEQEERIYDYVLDEKQRRALTEARDLASRTGMRLEVIDLSRQSALRRALGSSLDRLRSVKHTPHGAETSYN